VLGVLVPFGMGSVWAHGSGFDWDKSLFVAAAFVATSAGITARVLQELNALQRIESKVILGAAVIDDILAMLLLGVVVSLQGGGGFDLTHLLMVLAGAIGFIAVIGWGGTRVMRWNSGWLDKPLGPHSPLMIVLALCLGLAYPVDPVRTGRDHRCVPRRHDRLRNAPATHAGATDHAAARLAHAVLLRGHRQQDRPARTGQRGVPC
jgi:Kef-type K+ transport system membrane component KefB